MSKKNTLPSPLCCKLNPSLSHSKSRIPIFFPLKIYRFCGRFEEFLVSERGGVQIKPELKHNILTSLIILSSFFCVSRLFSGFRCVFSLFWHPIRVPKESKRLLPLLKSYWPVIYGLSFRQRIPPPL